MAENVLYYVNNAMMKCDKNVNLKYICERSQYEKKDISNIVM